MIAAFSVFAIYKYHPLALEGVNLLAESLDSLGGNISDSISAR